MSFKSECCSVTLTSGVMKNVLDFVHHITEESTAHFAAVGELIWITIEVGAHQQISIHGGQMSCIITTPKPNGFVITILQLIVLQY